jgi:hypothetical protein
MNACRNDFRKGEVQLGRYTIAPSDTDHVCFRRFARLKTRLCVEPLCPELFLQPP